MQLGFHFSDKHLAFSQLGIDLSGLFAQPLYLGPDRVRPRHGKRAGGLGDDPHRFDAAGGPAERRHVFGRNPVQLFRLRGPGVDLGSGDIGADQVGHLAGDLVSGQVTLLDGGVQRCAQPLLHVQRSLGHFSFLRCQLLDIVEQVHLVSLVRV